VLSSRPLRSIGAALCLRHLAAARAAPAAAIGLLVAGLAQGFTAQGDAVSHTRIAPTLVLMALLAALGFESLRRALAAARPAGVAAATAAAAVALSGLVLFLRITPAIEPSSWLAISLEALRTRRPNADAVFLEHGDPRRFAAAGPARGRVPHTLTWLFVEPIARLLPARPMATRTVAELERIEPGAAAPLYVWSPALEEDAAVSRTICARWPDAALYTLHDRPRLFHALAAAPAGPRWEPALPPGRWSMRRCPAPTDQVSRVNSPSSSGRRPASAPATSAYPRSIMRFMRARMPGETASSSMYAWFWRR
jgi:hypothetical protein